MTNKVKQKVFEVHVTGDIFYTAKIKADTLKGALEIAESLSHNELTDLPGEMMDGEIKIVGVFECS